MVSLRPLRRTPSWRTHLSDPASSIFPAAKASAETTIDAPRWRDSACSRWPTPAPDDDRERQHQGGDRQREGEPRIRGEAFGLALGIEQDTAVLAHPAIRLFDFQKHVDLRPSLAECRASFHSGLLESSAPDRASAIGEPVPSHCRVERRPLRLLPAGLRLLGGYR